MLQQLAAEGLIRLVYLDESGFERTSPLTYSYIKQGQQNRKAQRRSGGGDASVCWASGNHKNGLTTAW